MTQTHTHTHTPAATAQSDSMNRRQRLSRANPETTASSRWFIATILFSSERLKQTIIIKMFADLREAKALWAPAAPLMLTSLYAVWVPTPIAIEVRARVLAEQVSRSSRVCLESKQESVNVSIVCF